MERDISPRDAAARLDEDDGVQLVDVRTDEEWAESRIAGALHIELQSLSERAGEIDRERAVIFYCHAGSRSAMATRAFAEAGYDALNLGGGIEAWEAAGLPLQG